MTPRSPEPEKPGRLLAGVVVLVAVLTVAGLAIADFTFYHRVDELLVSSLVVIAFTFGGFGVDNWRRK